MKGFTKLLILGGLLVGSAAPAFADGVTDIDVLGHGVITQGATSGTITFTSNGTVAAPSYLEGVSIPDNTPFNFVQSEAFSFHVGAPTSVATPAGGTTGPQGGALVASYGGTQVQFFALTAGTSGGQCIGQSGCIFGTGYFDIGGQIVYATYTLTQTGSGVGFSAEAAATPEPGGLVLLGTGLLGAAGAFFRKRPLV